MTFNEVIGQKEAQERLIQMVREDRLPHALMLCGPVGSGKLALAIAFGCQLLDDGRPSSIAMLEKLEHPDLHFTYPTIKLPSMSADHKPVSDDFAVITVGESDNLIKKLSLKSSQGGYKVSIVWLPERMNIECANKLLKLIEEPPQQTVFIMVCEEPEKLLETIRSRVQRIDIKKTDTEDIRQALIKRRGIDEESAQRISRMANGNWLTAIEELQADSERGLFLDMYKSLMRLAYQRKVKDLRKWSEQMAAMGREKQKRWLNYFLRMTRENFVYNFHEEELNYMTESEEDFAQNFARFVNEANVLPISDLANLAIRDIGQNANAKIVFFDFALQMIVLLLQK